MRLKLSSAQIVKVARGENANRAFALVLVVVLLALLVVLLVGLATVARIESKVTENRAHASAAQRHALIGLSRALGELQRAAGPDACATARASFLPAATPNRAQWSGVWLAGQATPVWLVSSPPGLTPDPAGLTWQDPVELVGAATIDLAGDPAANTDRVQVETVPIEVPASVFPGWTRPDNPVVGRFAFWVGDEGVKTSLFTSDERFEVTGVAGSSPWARTEPGVLWGGLDVYSVGVEDNLAKALSYSQLGYAHSAFTPLRLRQNYHRATLTSLGLAANAATGGLREPAVIDGGNPYEPTGVPRYDEVYLVEAPPIDATVPLGLPAARFALRNRGHAPPPAGGVVGTEAASNIFIAGAFNVNAVHASADTQRAVWRSLLAAARTLEFTGGVQRELTEGELDALALQLTAARLRAGYAGTLKTENEPFRSLTDFARSGLMADALAVTSINDGRTPASVDYVSPEHVLAMLMPVFAVRSDTFVVRAYGDVRDPLTGNQLGEAWCEAQVQRVPDYVDGGDAPSASPSRPDNLAFGRRFVVTRFRWLTRADL